MSRNWFNISALVLFTILRSHERIHNKPHPLFPGDRALVLFFLFIESIATVSIYTEGLFVVRWYHS